MKIIKVSGTEAKRELAQFVQSRIDDSWLLALERGDESEEPATGEQIERWLADSGLQQEGGILVLESNEPFVGLPTALRIFITDVPLGGLEPYARQAAEGTDLVLVERGTGFEGADEGGLEASFKEGTGAGKVLVYQDDGGRERAFGKAADSALARLGGGSVREDIPREVTDAVKREASDGHMTCERAHALAVELDVPLELIGRALDLENIKITRCQLGCF